MVPKRRWQSGTGMLILIAVASILLHTLTNSQYGFHRDELATVDDGQQLDWGFAAYPPLTPFVARLAFTLFGPSLVALRFFASLAIGVAIVLAGWMAAELGGKRDAQILAGLAVVIGTASAGGTVSIRLIRFLWWLPVAYFTVRLASTEDPRCWLGIGARSVWGCSRSTRSECWYWAWSWESCRLLRGAI
jgi:4-amino-4-deoxy-L-arabinose transferase-like glycosyltransferase